MKRLLVCLLAGAAGAALSQVLPQVTVTATRSEASPFDVPAAHGWRGGVELRRSSAVPVNDANTDAAPSFTTVALHGGYVFNARGWDLAATARVDNVFDRRYAGSVIVNEGNGPLLRAGAGTRPGAEAREQLRLLNAPRNATGEETGS